jgi:DHA2 family multidrug resistance protein
MVLISLMLAMIMTALDQTIANVALPHMAGSVSASADQITWVLTSYIIAAAIMTPTTSWLAGRFGRKQVFLVSIIGFTVASALCGAAQNLEQIVLFRLLQGAFGAALPPLSQAVMLDSYPVEERGPIMAIWSMGVMVAPIVGPVLGGWLTDNFSWRWVFYINLPVGVLCAFGVSTFLHEHKPSSKVPFDAVGFTLLSMMLAAFQLFLDRGQNNDWFNSPEIVIEAVVAAVALILFAIHTATTDRPFLPVELLKDRNFVTATGLAAAVGLVVFSVMALLPPMTQTLLGYPVMTAGFVQAPRGVGSLIAMFFVGRLVGRVDTRVLIIFGLCMFALSFWGMSHFDLQMDGFSMVWTGFVQGVGMGFIFLPMTTLGFATLSPALRGDGTGVFTLVRNLGNAAGISVMEALVVRNTQVVHARLTAALTPDNPMAAPSLTSTTGIATLDAAVNRQASMVSYIDAFHLMFLTTLVAIPLVLLLRKPHDQILPQEPMGVD